MSRLFYHTVQDNVGNLLFDVQGTMRIAGSGTVATIYGDEALTIILPNPMTNHASFGSFKCFLGPGDYDFYMAKSGYNFETLTGVQGHGSMAQQDAGAVAITGGSAVLSALTVAGPAQMNQGIGVPNTTGDGITALASVVGLAGGSGRFCINHTGDAPSYFGGDLRVVGNEGIGVAPVSNARLHIQWQKASQYALQIKPVDSDSGNAVMQFMNLAGTGCGSITTTGAATAYNTSSDGRLKDEVEPLTGGLDIIRALNPVSFRWKVDGSRGHGLIAQEVEPIVPGVVSHTETLGIDYGKLVPWLVSAVKELTQQVEMLQAQLAAVGA